MAPVHLRCKSKRAVVKIRKIATQYHNVYRCRTCSVCDSMAGVVLTMAEPAMWGRNAKFQRQRLVKVTGDWLQTALRILHSVEPWSITRYEREDMKPQEGKHETLMNVCEESGEALGTTASVHLLDRFTAPLLLTQTPD